MKISLEWLSDFVEIADYFGKPEALAEILTKAGLEVEELTNKAASYRHVVTGLVLAKDKHPNADKLSLCQVMTQEGVVHQIVCGAQNHKAGDKVVVALPGAVLPGDFAIKKAVVRGVESGGMLCSEKELGLKETSDGILILPSEAPLGKGFADYWGLADITFELKVTPNRADCLSHLGLAREISTLLDRPLKKKTPVFPVAADSTQDQVALVVEDSQGCPRYTGRYIQGVKVQESPAWLKKRLESVGLKSINNVVDITNYVMMELGQPLHAFDASTIQEKVIRVKRSTVHEKFNTLDGTELTLTGEELMICDGAKSLALAGVVGGQNSGVSEATQDIFVESAYFDPAVVRKSARHHGIQTDSAYRFSRGVDPSLANYALDFATSLIVQEAGGVAFGNPWDNYPNPIQKTPVLVRLAHISQRLGYEVNAVLFETYLKRLGCDFEKVSGADEYKILPPLFRFDLEIEMDFVEEYGRLNGYENIPETLPETSQRPAAHDLGYLLRKKLRNTVCGLGYSESVGSAFASQKEEDEFLQKFESLKAAGLHLGPERIQIVNPLSDEMNVMRSSLSLTLWKTCLANYHQGNMSGRVFEIGKAFEKSQDGGFKEHWRLAMLAWGQDENLWAKTQSPSPLVLELKSALNQIFESFGITQMRLETPSDRGLTPLFLHQRQWAQILKEGARIGFIGTVHPVLVAKEKIRTDVVICELELESFFRGQPRAGRYRDFSRFPRVERDLALVMPKSLAAESVVHEILKAGGEICQEVVIFDQYIGDKVPAGMKSVAYRMSFQDHNGTLQDDRVNDAMKQILSSLQQKLGISPR